MANGIGGKILDFLSGGLVEKGLELGSKFVKDKDQAERFAHEFRTLVQTNAVEAARRADEHDLERERMFNDRTKEMEGTAADLKSLPIVGSIVLFLRGAFRPIFAYFTMYLYVLYFGKGMEWTDRQEALLYATGIIVLIFYFGERAAQNVLPVLAKVFLAKRDA